MNKEFLSKVLYEKEYALLKSEIRKSYEKIEELICDDFIEFTSSGKVYYYKAGDTFQEKDDNTELNWEIKDFSIKILSDDCALAMYKVIKHGEINKSKKCTLRSSIWKCEEENWKMVFHQGTITQESQVK